VLNVKSLGFRLLAETGILGFSAFLCFLLMIFILIIKLFREKRKFYTLIGWMGAFTLAAFFIEQLSLDSFALPYFWISFGMVSATSIVQQEKDSKSR
jgi:O-antigen ligase